MKINRKLMSVCVSMLIIITTVTSCSVDGKIYPVSREEGSGTRSAFVELAGIVDDQGRDLITQKSEITNSTAVMLQTIGDNKDAIGYVSLGSMAPTVKGVMVDGVKATGDNIKDGSYKIARTFNLILGEKVDPLAGDFIEFIKSREGQGIVEAQGYVKEDGAKPYEMTDRLKAEGGEPGGKITIAGSTSVAPVIEVIGASYMEMYPNVKIEIQQSGSSAGIIAVKEGVCEIGLSSRELDGEEAGLGLTALPIAKDGIVVIVSPENPLDQLTSQQVKEIFQGEKEFWDQV